jgi:hypothetical protein
LEMHGVEAVGSVERAGALAQRRKRGRARAVDSRQLKNEVSEGYHVIDELRVIRPEGAMQGNEIWCGLVLN